MTFLRRKEVEAMTGLSRSYIYASMAEGTFPNNVSVGLKGVRWVQSEIHTWCLEKLKNRK
ncbi:AlpA family phage regulatory protein [Glaciimonas sp. GS1]|uniref:AlpA family phage regulatory protein n=1 Tax=Glaciimonas soli TaxID=2590999 RepID=A0A843YS94_9BURK|nr:AlpA family phage regulatory protein [Glaciimonas soli]